MDFYSERCRGMCCHYLQGYWIWFMWLQNAGREEMCHIYTVFILTSRSCGNDRGDGTCTELVLVLSIKWWRWWQCVFLWNIRTNTLHVNFSWSLNTKDYMFQLKQLAIFMPNYKNIIDEICKCVLCIQYQLSQDNNIYNVEGVECLKCKKH